MKVYCRQFQTLKPQRIFLLHTYSQRASRMCSIKTNEQIKKKKAMGSEKLEANRESI